MWLLGFYLIKSKFLFSAVLSLDTSLLILAQSGMFVYCMFSLIGCHHTMTSSQGSGLTGFFSEFLSLNQVKVDLRCDLDI